MWRPKPKLDNPWHDLKFLENVALKPGSTGVFKIPFADLSRGDGDSSEDAREDDGK